MKLFLILCLVFFLPFVVFPWIFSPFETSKVIVAEIVIDLLLVLTIFKSDWSINKIARRQLYLLAGIFLLSLTDLFLFNQQTSLLGNQFRLQGCYLLWHLLVFAFLVSQVKINKIPFIFPALSFLLLGLSLIVFNFQINGRAVGLIGEPNALACFVLFLWPVVFLSLPEKFNKLIIKLIILISALIIIFLSGSRSGLVGLCIEIFFLLFASKTKISLSLITVFSVCLIMLSLSLPFIDTKVLYESRADIWQTALVAGFSHPVIGGGFGNTENLLRSGANTLQNNVRFVYVDSSHNLLLDWWVQGGAIGLLCILALFFLTIKNFVSNKKVMELTMLLGILTALSFNPASIVSFIGLWWLVGRGMRHI